VVYLDGVVKGAAEELWPVCCHLPNFPHVTRTFLYKLEGVEVPHLILRDFGWLPEGVLYIYIYFIRGNELTPTLHEVVPMQRNPSAIVRDNILLLS